MLNKSLANINEFTVQYVDANMVNWHCTNVLSNPYHAYCNFNTCTCMYTSISYMSYILPIK